MSNCKQCGKEIESHTGRRPKKFCNEVCRIAYFNANKPKERAMVKKATYDAVVAERDHYKAIVLGTNPVLERGVDTSEKEINALLDKVYSENKDEVKKCVADVTDFGMSISKHENGKIVHVPLDSEEAEEIQIKAHNEEIQKQITAIQKETIPSHRNTSIGKKVWEIEQSKRISELRSKLK